MTESSVPKAIRVAVKATQAAVATPGVVKAIRAAVAVKAILAAVGTRAAVAVKATPAKASQDKADKNKNRARANSPPGVRTALKPGAAGLRFRLMAIRAYLAEFESKNS